MREMQLLFWLLPVISVLVVTTALGVEKEVVIQYGSQAGFETLMRDVHVEPPRQGIGLTLVKRELVADETGEAYYSKAYYNNVGMETIAPTTWVRKEFVLQDPETAGASLCLSGEPVGEGSPAFLITVNGHTFGYETTLDNPGIKYMYDWRRWLCGWLDIPVPKEYLKEGLNTVIVRGDKGTRWRVGVELGLFPDRSAKSVDGGATWQRDSLGIRSSLNGEYVIRLALDRYPSAGVITSAPINLAAPAGNGTIGVPVRLVGVKVGCAGEFPQGTDAYVQVRLGRTATYMPSTWTSWTELSHFDADQTEDALGNQPGFRYLQYRIHLTTSSHLVAPVLRKVTVTAKLQATESGAASLELVELDNQTIVRPSRRFIHMGVGARQKMLADRLAPVIEDADSQYQMVRRLMNFAHQATPRNENALRLRPPRDALTMMELAGRGMGHVECEGLAEVMTQCAEAVGLNARAIGVGHIMTEVWLNEFGKWGLFDPSNGRLHYIDEAGRPMSALELLEALQAGRKTTVVRWWKGKELSRKTAKVWWAFDRFLISLRSNYNETARPLHYMDTYSSRAHLVVLNRQLEPLRFTDMQSRRRGDFEWTLNQARLHLVRRGGGKLAIQLESVMPNFKQFIVTIDGKPFPEEVKAAEHLDEVTGEFEWRPSVGSHEMVVYPVNAMGIPGIKSILKVKVRD